MEAGSLIGVFEPSGIPTSGVISLSNTIWYHKDKPVMYFMGKKNRPAYACFKKNWSYRSGHHVPVLELPDKDTTVFLDQFSGDVIFGFPLYYKVWLWLTTWKKLPGWEFKSIYMYSFQGTAKFRRVTTIFSTLKFGLTIKFH